MTHDRRYPSSMGKRRPALARAQSGRIRQALRDCVKQRVKERL